MPLRWPARVVKAIPLSQFSPTGRPEALARGNPCNAPLSYPEWHIQAALGLGDAVRRAATAGCRWTLGPPAVPRARVAAGRYGNSQSKW